MPLAEMLNKFCSCLGQKQEEKMQKQLALQVDFLRLLFILTPGCCLVI